ncbi:MAG: PrgI family protein [Patescibacteria group bacterium]
MNQFLVPQFIDVEPKILGPLTLRQFIIAVIGIVFAVVSYKFADLALFIVELIIIATLVILFAFIKINGQPFHFFLLNIFCVLVGSNIRVWTKNTDIVRAVEMADDKKEDQVVQKEEIKSQKLSELSLLLDTGGAFQGEVLNETNQPITEKEKNK